MSGLQLAGRNSNRTGPRTQSVGPQYEVTQKEDPKLQRYVDGEKNFIDPAHPAPVGPNGKPKSDVMWSRLRELSDIVNEQPVTRADRRKQEERIAREVGPYAEQLAFQIASQSTLPSKHRVQALEILGKMGKYASGAKDQIARLRENPDPGIKAAAVEAYRHIPDPKPDPNPPLIVPRAIRR